MLMAMDNVVIPREEIAVILITWSPGRGPNSLVPNFDQRDFSWIMKKSALMTASSLTDLNVNQDRNLEARNSANVEDGDSPGLRFIYDRQTHTPNTNL